LEAVRNRLEVKGRERALVTGKLQSGGGAQENPLTLIAEFAQSDTIDVKQRTWRPVLRGPDDAKQRSVDAARL
jgi:hypothetical protein